MKSACLLMPAPVRTQFADPFIRLLTVMRKSYALWWTRRIIINLSTYRVSFFLFNDFKIKFSIVDLQLQKVITAEEHKDSVSRVSLANPAYLNLCPTFFSGQARICELSFLCQTGSISVSGQLPTYPSPNSTTVNWQQVKVNVGLGEG